MKSETYEELNIALRNLCEDRNFLQSQIDENNLHIQESQSLNQKIVDSEDEDFRIFSPRKYKNLYRNELERSNTERVEYETQNSQILKKIESLNNLIKIMQDIMEESKVDEEEDQTNQSNPESVELQGNIYKNLEHVLHRVELSIKFISQDPDRAKMELAIVSENLRQILYQNIEES